MFRLRNVTPHRGSDVLGHTFFFRERCIYISMFRISGPRTLFLCSYRSSKWSGVLQPFFWRPNHNDALPTHRALSITKSISKRCPWHISDYRESSSFSKNVARAQTVAPISQYREFYETCVCVESLFFDRWRAADISKMGLVHNAIYLLELILFTSSFF
jgi:hypothetical protein